MDIVPIDIAIRGGATGLCILTTLVVFWGRVTWESFFAYATICFVASVNMWTRVGPAMGISDAVLVGMKLIGAGGAFSITWFILTIFMDDRRSDWAWLGSGVAIWIAIPISPHFPEFIPLLRGYAVVHLAALMSLIIYSAKGDLLNARRRVRPLICAFLIVYSLGQALTSRPMQDIRTTDVEIFQPLTFGLFMLVFAVWALKVNLNNWPGRAAKRPASEPTPQQQTQRQSVLIKRIQAKMEDGIWKEEGLTVGSLAQVVDAPEHQVRKAINQELGHRNFASFINGARIEEAKSRLQSEEDASKTVLEIAFDVGFSSLGPFNRAFRDATGMSPTDYRRQAAEAMVV